MDICEQDCEYSANIRDRMLERSERNVRLNKRAVIDAVYRVMGRGEIWDDAVNIANELQRMVVDTTEYTPLERHDRWIVLQRCYWPYIDLAINAVESSEFTQETRKLRKEFYVHLEKIQISD